MNEAIFTGSGIDMIKRESEYFIRYDTGTIAMIEKESKITSEEASKAQRSERDAYEVIVATQTREGKNKPFFSKK
ncbi:TPA: UxaA family hydrolase [Enterobacter hormaechei subsp. steigerwaltii]|nr:UxaA family hydrolase [Enterobacter hormaechei subsp. steigerwaltii]HAV1902491.1 UxaA family hydrolase [Enterobacter hormaechei subsp. steigerwaltii]